MLFVIIRVNPIVAKAGGIQSQGAKGEAVVNLLPTLGTQDLEFFGFPEGQQHGKNRPHPWNAPGVESANGDCLDNFQ